MRTALVDDRAVAGAAAMCSNTVEVDGRSVGAYGYVPLSGGVEPVALEGRLPSTTDEVALGSDTLANVGAGIGDRVEIAGPDDQGPCGSSVAWCSRSWATKATSRPSRKARS